MRLYSRCIESGNEASDCRRQAYAVQQRCESAIDVENEESQDNVCNERVRALYAECVEVVESHVAVLNLFRLLTSNVKPRILDDKLA